jgi:hypothetical protein
MDMQVDEALARLRGLDGDGPFGDARLRSNRIQAGVSHGLQEAAGNLLAKALRAVRAGDEARAHGYAQRAVRLPMDEHEEGHPGFWAATMLLFNAVVDAVETCDEDDPAWLDAADQVLQTASGEARQALLHTLSTIASDYHLPHHEARRIRHLLGDAEPPDWPSHDQPEPAQAAATILAVVHTVAAYHQVLAT